MKGYHVKINGLNIDSTIEKINRKDITLYELKRSSHTNLEFNIKNDDYKKIKPILDKYDKQVFPLGFNFFKKLISTNLAILIALPICIALFFLSSNLVWKIEISGVQGVHKQEILNTLKKNDITISSKIKKDAKDIEELLLQNEFVAQVSCYYKGSTLFVNISEKLVYIEQTYQPIVAKYNGIILDCTFTRGTINFVVGEYVSKGDILVYPYVLDKFGKQIPVEPKAEIVAKCIITETNIIPRKENILTRTGKTKTYSNLTFNKKKNPVKNRKPFVFYETMVYNDYISSVLPIVRQKTVYYELQLTERVNNLEDLVDDNEQLVKNTIKTYITNNVEIIEENINSIIIEDCLYSTAYLICICNIN